MPEIQNQALWWLCEIVFKEVLKCQFYQCIGFVQSVTDGILLIPVWVKYFVRIASGVSFLEWEGKL